MTIDVRPPPVALELMAQGRFQEALAALELAVSRGNIDPVTLLNLAIAQDRTGAKEDAQRLMQQVAERLPAWDEPVLRLAESLRSAGECAAAEDAYRRVLALNSERQEALVALSGLLLMRGKTESARDLLQRCCGINPNNAEAWNTLGVALRSAGAFSQALSAFVVAQRLRPDCVDYVLNGVEVTVPANEGEAELARLAVACDQQPLNAAVQIGRGSLLQRLGRLSDAIDALEAVTELAPGELIPLRLLGGMLLRANRVRQAEEVLRQARTLAPNDASLANDHAVMLMRLHRHPEARAVLENILAGFPGNNAVLCNLAVATSCVGEQEEAVAMALRAIKADPVAALPRRALCNTLPYSDGVMGKPMLAAMRACSVTLPRTTQPALHNDPDPNRPIVVGLLSGALRAHPVGYLTVAGFETLDPDMFSLICLAQHGAPEDPIARRYRTASREWIDVDTLNDVALTELARAKGIDVLIDLGGYGDAARMTACANRLAPVQIKWVGSQAHSSGLAEMDWFVTDRWETPEGYDQLYNEKLLRLRDGYVCYSPPTHAPDVVEPPGLANGFVTYGCFNNLAKITPKVLQTWARILHRVPRSRMILKTHQFSDPATVANFQTQFANLGIEGSRIELRGSSGHRAFMGEYGQVDIVLDPFPYSGGLTTCEALWMGVPTITLPGEIFASRHSASHLSNAGLEEWVTSSIDEYVEMAVVRSADLPALAALRAELRDRVRRSPLCDAPRFGRSLGAGLRHAWQTWCAEKNAG